MEAIPMGKHAVPECLSASLDQRMSEVGLDVGYALSSPRLPLFDGVSPIVSSFAP
jgi:hypothetical protein